MAQMTVLYEDGREETYEIRPKTMIQAERYLGKNADAHLMELSFLIGWKASKSPSKFDDWLDDVASVTQSPDEEGADSADPTPERSPAE